MVEYLQTIISLEINNLSQYINIKSLCYIYETDILYVNYFSIEIYYFKNSWSIEASFSNP